MGNTLRELQKPRESAETKGPADAGPEIQSGGVDGKSLMEAVRASGLPGQFH